MPFRRVINNAKKTRRELMPDAFFLIYSILCIDICIFCMFLDEFPSRRHFIAHEHRKDPVCFGCGVDGYLPEGAMLGIHCCIPELFCIHLTQPLVPLNMNTGFSTIFFHQLLSFLFGPAIAFCFSLPDQVKRWRR